MLPFDLHGDAGAAAGCIALVALLLIAFLLGLFVGIVVS